MGTCTAHLGSNGAVFLGKGSSVLLASYVRKQSIDIRAEIGCDIFVTNGSLEEEEMTFNIQSKVLNSNHSGPYSKVFCNPDEHVPVLVLLAFLRVASFASLRMRNVITNHSG